MQLSPPTSKAWRQRISLFMNFSCVAGPNCALHAEQALVDKQTEGSSPPRSERIRVRELVQLRLIRRRLQPRRPKLDVRTPLARWLLLLLLLRWLLLLEALAGRGCVLARSRCLPSVGGGPEGLLPHLP